MTDNLSLCKLMILYMLDFSKYPLYTNHIIDCITGRGYTDYFTTLSAITELCEQGMIAQKTVAHTTFYTISQEGGKTIGLLKYQIPDSFIKEINSYITGHTYELRNAASAKATYHVTKSSECMTHLSVREGEEYVIDMKILLPTEKAARKACEIWPKISHDVYKNVLDLISRN